MLRLIALRGVRAQFTTQAKRYISADWNRVGELLLHLENNQIKPNNVETLVVCVI